MPVSTGASACQMIEVDGCYFESIEVLLDVENEDPLLIYDPISDKKTNVDKLYFISNHSGKKIKTKTVKKERNKPCRQKEEHSKILTLSVEEEEVKKEEDEGETGFEVRYPNIVTDVVLDAITDALTSNDSTKYWTSYLTLSKFDSGSALYAEEQFWFLSCADRTKMFKLIVYPDIKYGFNLDVKRGKSFVGQENPGEERNFETKKSSELGASLTIEYNDNKTELVSFSHTLGKDSVLTNLLQFSEYLSKLGNIKKTLYGVFGKLLLKGEYFEFDIKSPSGQFTVEWQYDVKKDHTDIGKLLTLSVGLSPLIGGSITWHVLNTLLAGFTGGGFAALSGFLSAAKELFKKVGKGKKESDDGADARAFIDIIFTADLNIKLEGKFSDVNPNSGTLNTAAEFSLELKVGVLAKAECFFVGVSAELSASGKGGIKFDLEFKYVKDLEIEAGATLLPIELKVVAKAQVKLWKFKFGPNKEWKWTLKEASPIGNRLKLK